MIGRNTVATCFTIWSMRAGLPGDAWLWMSAIDWRRAVQRKVWS